MAVVVPVIQSLRELPEADRPAEVYGVEVWRDLNWLIDDEKVLLNMNDRPNLVRALISIFDSQITGGKRYDLALEGDSVATPRFSIRTRSINRRWPATRWI